MKIAPFFLRITLLGLMFGTAGPALASAVENHPLINPYEGSVLVRREDVGHSDYAFVTGLNATGKSDAEVLPTNSVTGDLTRLFYDNPAGKSPLEIISNYRDALVAAKFEVVFECGDKECGPSYAGSRWGRITGMKYTSAPLWFLSARRRGSNTETYVSIACMKPRHQIDILEAKSMERGKVVVTLEALKQGIAEEGRVVLEGLYFDTDKATLKGESKPALDVIAEFLKADPRLNVYIVGHTDSDGTLEHNMTLSSARAQAVVAALVSDYKIDRARLSGHGVGPLSPAKSNRSEKGKAGNRRVEMVPR